MNDVLEMGCPECGGAAGFWQSVPVWPEGFDMERDYVLDEDGHPPAPLMYKREWSKCNCKERDTPKEDAETIAALDGIFEDINDCYHALYLQWEALPDGYDFSI